MSGFPVYCSNGHPLRDVDDRPCPVCGSNEAKVAMSASSMVAGTGGATMSGYSIFATMQRSWPFIAGWLVVFAIQIWCAAEYSGWKSVVATVVLTIISTVVGYFAITRVLQQKRVF